MIMIYATDAGIAEPLAYSAKFHLKHEVVIYESTILLAAAMEQYPLATVVLWTGSILPASVAVKEFRSSKLRNPIFVLMRDDSVKSRIHLLVNGADDVQPAPIDPAEFAARLHALIRRAALGEEQNVKVLKLPNGAVLNLDSGKLSSPHYEGHLTPKEVDLLMAIVAREGFCVTKESLLATVYSGVDEPLLKIIDVFICKIRKKLEKATGGLDCLETVWGRGYMFRGDGFMPVFTAARWRAQAGKTQ